MLYNTDTVSSVLIHLKRNDILIGASYERDKYSFNTNKYSYI